MPEARVSTIRAALELRDGTSTPTGALTWSNGTRHPFEGWTELASAIEEWRISAAADGERRPRQERE